MGSGLKIIMHNRIYSLVNLANYLDNCGLKKYSKVVDILIKDAIIYPESDPKKKKTGWFHSDYIKEITKDPIV